MARARPGLELEVKADRRVAAAIGVILLAGSAFTADGLRQLDQIDPKLSLGAAVTGPRAGGPTPAATALATVLAQVAPGAEVSDGVIDPAGAQACEQSGTPVPALSRHVTVGSAQISLAVYRAGLGAAAFTAQEATLTGCPGVSSQDRDGLGVQALQAHLGTSETLLWRRGDVLATVTRTTSIPAVPAPNPPASSTPAPAAPAAAGTQTTSAAELVDLAARTDAALATALTSCADQRSTATDAARAPLSDRAFTGNVRTFTVTPDAATAALLTKADQVTSDLPYVDLPERPADPVWPAALPAPVARPDVPTAPTLPATSTSFRARVADPAGPGCGWAFLRQSPPPFDTAAAAASVEQRRSDELTRLQLTASEYAQKLATYRAAVERYQTQAQAYQTYLTEVETVADAWRQLRHARRAYERDLREYNDAVAARAAFLDDQARADRDYQDALQTCANLPAPVEPPQPSGLVPTGTPTIPSPPTPGQTPSAPTPSPTGTAPPTVPPTSPSPGTSTGTSTDPSDPPGPSGPTCPPRRPAILSQTAPTIPPAPTPPADPRPESAR